MSIIGFFYTLPFIGFFFPDSRMISFLGVTNGLVLVGVPLLAVIMLSARLAFKTQIAPQWRASMLAFWLVNLVSFVLVGVFVSREFNQGTGQEISIAPMISKADTVHIKLANTQYDNDDIMMQLGHLQLSGDQLINDNIRLNIRKSDTDHFELVQKNYARGRDWEEANSLVENINFEVNFADDKTIIIPPNILINRGEKWRAQRVELTLKVPNGKKIALDKSMDDIHLGFDLDDNYNHPWDKHDKVWAMGTEGLFCPEHFKEINYKEDYSFKNFSKVQVEGYLTVNVTKGDRYSIDLNGNKKYTNKVEVFMFGNTLNVTANRNRHHHHHQPLVLNITMPSIESLDIKNTGLVNLRGFQEKSLTIRQDSRDDLKVFVEADSLNIKQIGNGDLDLNGTGRYLKAVVQNHAHLNAERYLVKEADLKTQNGSRIKANVSENYRKDSKKGGRISIEGDGTEIEKEVMLSQTEQ